MAEQKHPPGAPGEWKPPNFKLIVILSSVVLVVLLIAAMVLVKTEGSHMLLKTKQTPATQN